ncbi:MAG: SBBP repeat-containing protein, partial [Bacteroidetes bacterium]|nr:SBBP repeat-containing protein [Bacteroidota bacterium]
MKKLLILLLIICSSKFLFGQKVEWIKKVNASYKQGLIPQYVHVDGKGNLNLIMNLNSKGVFGKDTVDSGLLAIPKYDTSGTLINLIVVKDTPLNLEVNALTIDKEGNHYLVGGFHKTKNPTSNYFLMKTNSLGKVIWRVQNYYGVSGQGISVDDKGNIFVSGYIKDSFSLDTFKYKNLNGSWNSFTARLDTSGKVKWVKFFHYSKGFTSSPKAMAHSHGNIIGDNGKLYVVGHAEAIASIDTFIVK